MTLHIGIVGCSSEGAALCYRTICTEAGDVLGKHSHPEVSMHTPDFKRYMLCFEKDDWDGVGDLMAESAEKLARIGADFVMSPDNTIHKSFDRAAEKSSLPWLHIAEEVASVATERGFHRLAVLGTRFLMEGPVYPVKLDAAGVEHRIPPEEDRSRIHNIIFDELVCGRFTVEARDYFAEVIGRMQKTEGCDAAVLGCTEIPLLISDEHSPLPTLDSTRILARAALRRAIQPQES